MMEIITKRLLALGDPGYRDFTANLIPNVHPERIIGVRMPELRRLAKELAADNQAAAFLEKLPHYYLEENHLHGLLLSGLRDYPEVISRLDAFLPHVDNWATSDAMNPAVFRKHRRELIEKIPFWLSSEYPYAVRFGIGMLMAHYLDEDFDPLYLTWAAQLRREEYYINMMRAWYMATALAKQYEAALPIIEEGALDQWTHNKTIRKAMESYRISEDHKTRLKSLIRRK